MHADRRAAIAWTDAVRATALHAADTDWREICRLTGLSEWQWKRVRQLYNATLHEATTRRSPTTPTRRQGPGDSLDFALARDFIASIPKGCWAAYGDVAAAAGAPKGAQALAHWLATNEIDVPPLLYRVIRSDGQVSPGYVSVDWPGLPDDPAAVERKLRSEGVYFDHRGRATQGQRWLPAHWRRARRQM